MDNAGFLREFSFEFQPQKEDPRVARQIADITRHLANVAHLKGHGEKRYFVRWRETSGGKKRPLYARAKCDCGTCEDTRYYRELLRRLYATRTTGTIVVTHVHSGHSESYNAESFATAEHPFHRYWETRSLRDRRDACMACAELLRQAIHRNREQARLPRANVLSGHHSANCPVLPAHVPPADGTVMAFGSRIAMRDLLSDTSKLHEKLLSVRKVPATGEPHISVEIECGVPDVLALNADLAAAGLGRYVNHGSDGSVSVRSRHSSELRVSAPETKLKEVLTKTCEALRKNGAKVNASCGLHVHIDCRARNWRVVYDRLYKAKHWLYACVAPSRANNSYAKPPSAEPNMGDRYTAINATSAVKHGTIEVRLHHGTTNAKKILNWVRLLLAIVDGPDVSVCPRNLLEFATLYDLPLDLITWIAQRAETLGGAKREKLTLPRGTLNALHEEDLGETAIEHATDAEVREPIAPVVAELPMSPASPDASAVIAEYAKLPRRSLLSREPHQRVIELAQRLARKAAGQETTADREIAAGRATLNEYGELIYVARERAG